MRIFFVFNLRAGKGQVKTNLASIIETICAAGHELTVHATQFAGDAKETVTNLPEGQYDRVLCAGGDGTLDEVVSGMSHRDEKLPIGYIPAGSTNDFAVSLGLPKRMKDAARVAIGNNILASDVGLFNEKSFVYIAAFGLFTEVSYQTPQDMKNVLGHSAYILEGMKKLQDVRSYKMTVNANNKTLTGNFLYGMVTNSQSVGGFKNITGKNVDLTDGLFEVTLVKEPKHPFELTETLNALLNRDIKAPGLVSFKTRKAEFIFDEEVSWTLDGEFGGKDKNFVIENIPQSLQIAVK